MESVSSDLVLSVQGVHLALLRAFLKARRNASQLSLITFVFTSMKFTCAGGYGLKVDFVDLHWLLRIRISYHRIKCVSRIFCFL